MARVLFLTQVLPFPLDSGAKIRAYYVLRHLASRHRVTLVSFVRADDKQEHIDHLKQFCTQVHTVPMVRSRMHDGRSLVKSLISGQPVVIVRDRVPAMIRLLRELVAQTPFDAVHVDQTSMSEYGLLARQAHLGKRPFALLDQHNAMYLLVRRQAGYERGIQRLIWQIR